MSVSASDLSAIDALQRDVLQAVATGRPLAEVMDRLCREVEGIFPDVHCSVLTIDERGRIHPLAGPSLSPVYSAALDGVPIGPRVGSCGTAAWLKTPVEVSDIAHDPLWADYKHLALAHGLAACWSSPVLMADGRVTATFALYYDHPRVADEAHRHAVQACVHLCQIALAQDERARRIEELAYSDDVTGLPNRRRFTEQARAAIEAARRGQRTVGVLLLDLDRFKTINDTLGHNVGDKLLAVAARTLKPCLREGEMLARFGGDEFVVLLADTEESRAQQLADALHAALALPLALDDGLHLQLSVSVGLCLFPRDGDDLDRLMQHADVAMYEAKRAGRNTTRVFAGHMTQALQGRMQLEAELRQAWQQRAFTLHYQPKLRLDGPWPGPVSLIGVEALVRWPLSDGGWVPPDRFIPVAEDCGLVNELDAWVLEQACAQLAGWAREGLSVPGVAVNASPTRFYRDDVVAHLDQVLAQRGLQASQITLEITERLLLGDDPRTLAQLQALHARGVRLSVDDFGTGYSSLSYLKRMPVSELKLDRSFVRDLETDEGDRALSQAVISIGQALGLQVVAEGVETAGQHRLLRQAGCHVGQGYLYGRPMPPQALSEWLTATTCHAAPQPG